MEKNISWFKEQWTDEKFRICMVVVLASGIGLSAIFSVFSYNILKILRYLILYAALFLTAWIDQGNKRIPNKILKVLLGIRGILIILEWLVFPKLGLAVLISALSGMLIGGGMFLLAHFLTKGGVGMGDVKLLAVIGAYMGSGSIMAVAFLSVAASAFYSIVMLLLKKIKLKEEIPFAPFIFVGTVLTMALGM